MCSRVSSCRHVVCLPAISAGRKLARPRCSLPLYVGNKASVSETAAALKRCSIADNDSVPPSVTAVPPSRPVDGSKLTFLAAAIDGEK